MWELPAWSQLLILETDALSLLLSTVSLDAAADDSQHLEQRDQGRRLLKCLQFAQLISVAILKHRWTEKRKANHEAAIEALSIFEIHLPYIKASGARARPVWAA
jgi:hypothetical protein